MTLKVGSIPATTNANALINGYIIESGNRDLLKLGSYAGSQNGTEDLFNISHDGNVEIKTKGTGHILVARNNDGQKVFQLENDGLLLAREIKVNTLVWADYVFNKGYKLLNLNELEKFIKTNNHLPNIPSAKQIAREGLNIGGMQRLQMEKIEELTLYTIQQDKDIKELNKENKMLKTELQQLKTEVNNIKKMLNK